MAALSLLASWGDDLRYMRCRLCGATYRVPQRTRKHLKVLIKPVVKPQELAVALCLFAESELPPVKPPKPRKIGPRKAPRQRKTA